MDGVSPATGLYNCIAWAAAVTDQWWEPDQFGQYFWPDEAPREYTLDAYIGAFRSRGFDLCVDGSLEGGTEKIAIYTLNGFPLHAARQLEDGSWTSKMGECEDIQHLDPSSVSGPFYGNASVYMGRKTK